MLGDDGQGRRERDRARVEVDFVAVVAGEPFGRAALCEGFDDPDPIERQEVGDLLGEVVAEVVEPP